MNAKGIVIRQEPLLLVETVGMGGLVLSRLVVPGGEVERLKECVTRARSLGGSLASELAAAVRWEFEDAYQVEREEVGMYCVGSDDPSVLHRETLNREEVSGGRGEGEAA